MLNNAILFSSFILIIYDPWFFQTLRGFIIGSLITLTLYITRKKNTISKDNVFLILLTSIFLAISIIPTIAHSTFDYSVFIMYTRMLIYVILLYFLYSLIPEKNKLLYFLKLSIYFQCFIAILCILSSDLFRSFIFSVHTVENFFYDSEQGYRLYLFTSMAFFQLSLFFGFLFNFLLNLYIEKKINLYPIIFCFICGLLSGRSFLLFSFISILICGFNIKIIISFIIGLLTIYFVAINFQDNLYVYHALEPIIQYINNKEVKSSSTDQLINKMLIWPSEKQFLLGDGLYTNDDKTYYLYTDSGYLRQIFYGGILYLILCLTFTIYIVRRISLNWFKQKRMKFFISTMLILSIGHIKADVFMYPGITLFLLFLLAFYTKSKQ